MSIRGDGVAARCCGHLLGQAGYQVSFEPTSRARVPLIMLSAMAQNLICDIFQRGDLFHDLPQIRKRVVAWGSEAVEVEHSAVVVSEEDLLDRLGAISEGGAAAWTICAAPPLPAGSVGYRFGARMATAQRVEMKCWDTCWMESVQNGWLFLNSGWLLAVGASTVELLAESRVVAQQISSVDGASVSFPASPRMITPLGGEKWISCGSAAMGFDPLCGDGTAHAVREAILASAVIRAVDAGEDREGAMAHYEARLTAGFQRHLAECRKYYSSGGSGAWWAQEAEACGEGMEWCRSRLPNEFFYRLEGLDLKRVDV